MNKGYLIILILTLTSACGSAGMDYRNPGCQVNKTGNITNIRCFNGRTVVVQDSLEVSLPDDATIVNMVSPCSPTVDADKELLIMAKDHTLYSAVPDQATGIYDRLDVLDDGTYRAFQSPDCTFRVGMQGSQRSIVWNGGGNVF